MSSGNEEPLLCLVILAWYSGHLDPNAFPVSGYPLGLRLGQPFWGSGFRAELLRRAGTTASSAGSI